MTNIFKGETANQVWTDAAKVLDNISSIQDSRLGDTKELLHVFFEINNPIQRWVHSRVPAINPAFSIAEVIWILSGSNEASFINYWNPALPNYAGFDKNYYGAYGHRIRSNFGLDQLDKAFSALKSNPDTRQIVIQIWDPIKDLPNFNGTPQSDDIPCNICSLVKIRDNKIDWLQIMRSNDHYRGAPYNFVQFTSIQEILAGWLNCDVGTYCQVNDSSHLYVKDITDFSYLEHNAEIYNNDRLAFSRCDFDCFLNELHQTAVELTQSKLDIAHFKKSLTSLNLPTEYKNWIYILGADSARRRGWVNEKNWASDRCTNNALKYIWMCWDKRWHPT
ncbi:MAG: thymidylate synthase [Candidatus Thiodiazotropha sp.]